MSDANEEIRGRVVTRVDEQAIEVSDERDRVRAVVSEAVEAYQRAAHLGRSRALADPSGMVERVMRSVADFGPLTDLLHRDDLEEVFIEGSRVSYLEAGGRLRALDEPTSERENRQVPSPGRLRPPPRRFQPTGPGPGTG